MKNLINKLNNVTLKQKIKVYNYLYENDFKIIIENENYYLIDLIMNTKKQINKKFIEQEYNYILENYNNFDIERIIFNY